MRPIPATTLQVQHHFFQNQDSIIAKYKKQQLEGTTTFSIDDYITVFMLNKIELLEIIVVYQAELSVNLIGTILSLNSI